jgi:hypothetical protein
MKYILIFVLFFIFFACEENSTDPNNPHNSTPVIVSGKNFYTYSINADEYTSQLSNTLNFDADSIEIYISLGNYQNGSGIFTVKSKSETIYSDSLNGNKTVVKTDLALGVPEITEIDLVDFSGDVSIVVKAVKY